MSAFSDRLKQLRLDKGENQSDIAAFLGVSVQSYSAYEGSREPKYDLLCKIAEHYDVTTDYLLGMSDAKKPDAADVMKVTGLSEKAIDTLKLCVNRDKDNSITLTVNTLLESRYVLGSIAHYLYYELQNYDDTVGPDLGKTPRKMVPFSERYKYLHADPSSGWGEDVTPPIDFEMDLDIFNNEKYKKLMMLNVQEGLEKLLEQENGIKHFEK